MPRGYKAMLVVLALALVLSLGGIAGCGGGNSQTPTPAGSPGLTPTPSASSVPTASPTQPLVSPIAVEPNDSAVTARLVVVRGSTLATMPRWEVDMEIYTSTDVFGLANLTKDKVGQTITVYTNQYMLGFSQGQGISCNVKLVSGGPEGSYYFTEQIK